MPKLKRFLARDKSPLRDSEGLLPQQRLFVEELFADSEMNATRAKLAAGYSEKVSNEKLLQNQYIKKAINDRREKLVRKVLGNRSLEVTQEWVLEELAKVARSQAVELFEGDMNDSAKLKPLDQLSEIEKSSISKINLSYDPISGKTFVRRIEFHDKLRALETLSKYLGLFEKDNKQKTQGVDVEALLNALPAELSDAVRLQLLRRINQESEENRQVH